ncbi:DUF6538 domain-containing protein [Agrobacterium tumefaciens]|uniref:DUF6538 domain-containing protein n=1 Tax=Agrobacterium tumefaciens TaxID=358 RepID=UPI003B9DEA0D
MTSNFLRREADSFFFRRRVPASLQARLGQTEIYRSLKTTVRRTARARAAHLGFMGWPGGKDLDRRLMEIRSDLLGVWETIQETERAMRSGTIPKSDG